MPITPYATIFPVNGTTTGDQKNQSVARLTDGRFIVTYESSDTAGQGVDIRTRIFYPDGTPQGPDFLVNQGVVAGNRTGVVAYGVIGMEPPGNPGTRYGAWSEHERGSQWSGQPEAGRPGEPAYARKRG